MSKHVRVRQVRKMELEGQLRSANVILKQKQENEEEIIHRLQEVQEVSFSAGLYRFVSPDISSLLFSDYMTQNLQMTR